MKQEQREQKEQKERLIEAIIEELIAKSGDKMAVTCWGEPALLLCDVINIINNIAETDYKRYWAYNCAVKPDECTPKNEHPLCSVCENYWRKQKSMHGCLGIKVEDNQDTSEKPCDRYVCTIGKNLK